MGFWKTWEEWAEGVLAGRESRQPEHRFSVNLVETGG